MSGRLLDNLDGMSSLQGEECRLREHVADYSYVVSVKTRQA